jgi:thiosulfate/3-mercaptopyruvate sulfurtransferase
MRVLLINLCLLISVAMPAITLAQEATPAASPTAEGYTHPELLADAAWLEAHLSEPKLRVVALTSKDDFAKAHIPGAVQIDWPDLNLADTSDPSIARWQGDVEQKLTALGIAPDDSVVIYDGGTLYAARLWWVLHQLGHKDKRILNGGLPAWIAAGGKTETGPSTPKPASSSYKGAPNSDAIATLDEVKAALDDPNTVLVDARTPEEYQAGHIPGAININFPENAAPNDPHYWKPAAELHALYEQAGVTPDKHVIPYCTTGVRSAVTYFTLTLLGYTNVSLYTGSWAEWSTHPELPVEKGTPTPG